MITKYKNKDLILNGQVPIYGNEFSSTTYSKTKQEFYVPNIKYDIVPYKLRSNLSLELHLYNLDGSYLFGTQNVKSWVESKKYSSKVIELNVNSDIIDLGLYQGSYFIVYNFFLDVLSSYENISKIYIDTISQSRKEIKLKLSDILDNNLKTELKLLKEYSELNKDYWDNLVLNFSNNKTARILNYYVDLDKYEIYIKLYEPLDLSIQNDSFCFICTELMEPYIDRVNIIPFVEEVPGFKLKGPNFNIEDEYVVNQETIFKSWDYLVASGSSSQQVIEKLFGAEILTGIRINVDYGSFRNFIKFSSAEERIENFFFKLKQVELYDDKLTDLNQLLELNQNNSFATQELIKNKNLKENTIKGFDDFEKYLYFGFEGNKYTHYGSLEIPPFPKVIPPAVVVGPLSWNQMYPLWINASFSFQAGLIGTITGATTQTTYPFSIVKTYSNEGIGWYNDLIDKARYFDKNNLDALRWFLPGHIVDNSYNEGAVMFMDMLAHHYDLIWLYIKNLQTTFSAEEHIYDGTSPDLLYNIAKHFGWTLTNGKPTNELWETFFGINEDNEKIQPNLDGIQSIESDIATKQIWKRIVNNLPFILKTKGTNRSVRAIINSYGIPSSILYAKEFGGPTTEKFKSNLKLNKYQYSLRLKGNESIRIPFNLSLNFNSELTDFDVWQDALDFWENSEEYWDDYNNEIPGSYLYPNSIFLRVESLNYKVFDYSSTPEQLIFTKKDLNNNHNFYVTLKHQGNSFHPDRADVTLYYRTNTDINSASINDLYICDGDFYNITLQRATASLDNYEENQLTLYVSKEKYGKIVIFESASINVPSQYSNNVNDFWNRIGEVIVAKDTSLPYDAFIGSIREFRYWAKPLSIKALQHHTLAARSYVGNTPIATFYDLSSRYIFGNNTKDVSLYATMSSQHPNQKLKTFLDGTNNEAYLQNFTAPLKDMYTGYSEDQYFKTPSIGGQNYMTTKIRIEDQELLTILNADARSTKAYFDDQPLDKSKLVIAFSPQDVINEDIISHIGDVNLDNYIGNPVDDYKNEYPDLRKFTYEYWQKYENRNDFNAFFKLIQIYDFGVFEQIKQVLPFRSNSILGTLIEPNILERNKIKFSTIPTYENVHYEQKDPIKINSEGYKLDYLKTYEADLPKEKIAEIKSNEIINNQADLNIINNRVLGDYTIGAISKINNVWNSYVNKTIPEIEIFIDKYKLNNNINKRVYFYSTNESASLQIPNSSSYIKAPYESANSLNIGLFNNRYGGCISKISPIDGKSSVEIFRVNPNDTQNDNDILKKVNANLFNYQNKFTQENLNDITNVTP